MSEDVKEIALRQAKEHGGKLEVVSKAAIENRRDLSIAYTPGVAAVSSAIAEDKQLAYSLTTKKNTVAVVSDGSAVLGLGNIGAEAAMPVMEGKAALFKRYSRDRRDHCDRQSNCTDLWWNQLRRYQCAALLRNRTAADRRVCDPDFPR